MWGSAAELAGGTSGKMLEASTVPGMGEGGAGDARKRASKCKGGTRVNT